MLFTKAKNTLHHQVLRTCFKCLFPCCSGTSQANDSLHYQSDSILLDSIRLVSKSRLDLKLDYRLFSSIQHNVLLGSPRTFKFQYNRVNGLDLKPKKFNYSAYKTSEQLEAYVRVLMNFEPMTRNKDDRTLYLVQRTKCR